MDFQLLVINSRSRILYSYELYAFEIIRDSKQYGIYKTYHGEGG